MNAEKVRAMLDLSAQWDEAEIALRAAEKRYRQAVSLLSKEELAHFYKIEAERAERELGIYRREEQK